METLGIYIVSMKLRNNTEKNAEMIVYSQENLTQPTMD